MAQKIIIKTWRCGNCGYAQDFEPTQENMDLHFNSDDEYNRQQFKHNKKVARVEVGNCPGCHLKGNYGYSLPRETDPAKKIVITVKDEADVDDLVMHDGEIKSASIVDADNEELVKYNYTAEKSEPLDEATKKQLKSEIRNKLAEALALEDK